MKKIKIIILFPEAQNKYEEGLRILATFKPNSQEANQDKENNDFRSIKSRLAL